MHNSILTHHYASYVPREDSFSLTLTEERMNTELLKMDLVVCSGAVAPPPFFFFFFLFFSFFFFLFLLLLFLLQIWGPHISKEQYWSSFGIFGTLKSLWVWGRKTTYKQTITTIKKKERKKKEKKERNQKQTIKTTLRNFNTNIPLAK